MFLKRIISIAILACVLPSLAKAQATADDTGLARSFSECVATYSIFWALMEKAGKSSPEQKKQLNTIVTGHTLFGFSLVGETSMMEMIKESSKQEGDAIKAMAEQGEMGKYAESRLQKLQECNTLAEKSRETLQPRVKEYLQKKGS